jgi:DNA-directed RNA polymerase subunit beta'
MSEKSNNTLNLIKQNEIIENSLVKNITSVFPIVGKYRTMTLNDFKIEDMPQNDYPTQKDVKLSGKSWQTPMIGNITITDNITNEKVDSAKIKLANIPILTNRYSVIIKGNEYQTVNQFRLKSGVYTREKTNGETESAFNLEKGFNFKMIMHPKEGIFYLNAGNQNYHLYTVLSALGVSDVDMRKAWGVELFQKNQKSGIGLESKELPALYEKVRHKKLPVDQALEGLKNYFENDTRISAETTEITLGKSFDRVTPELLMETSRKLLKVVKREEPDDERDSLIFKDLYTVSDLLNAHFDARKKAIIQGVKYRLDTKVNSREIISSDTFNKPILDFFYKGELSSTPTQTNPIDILNEYRKTTIMGPGGVGTEHAITPEMRDVHPSHLGFVDPTSTPESGAVGITLGLSLGATKTGDKLETRIRMKNGELKHLSPYEIYNMKIGYPDQYMFENGKPKAAVGTQNKIKANYRGKPIIVPYSEIDGFFDESVDLFSFSTNLIPFLGYNSGNRVQIGSKMLAQAVPLKNPDAPLVQVKSPQEEKTMEELLGKYLNPGLVTGYHKNGVVTKITADYVYYKDVDGDTKKIGLFNHFPLNQDSFLHSTPIVKIGDKVKAGDIIATNNFQKDGVLALGANLHVAYMPWKGQTFEDSIVITEAAAQKLTSTHIMKEELQINKDGIQSIDKYNAYFPGNLTKENMDKLDELGIIKEGQTVSTDEILGIYMEPRDLTNEEKILKSMYKALTVPYVDRSLKWEHNLPGFVRYVRRVGNKIQFTIEVEAPTEIGDKLVGRYGNKGIVSKIIRNEEAPHTKDGERVDVILSPFGYPGRTNSGQILETAASKIAIKTGKPYIIENFNGVDYLDKIQKDLKANNLQSEEILLDGKNGKPFENPVLTGYQNVLKLRHVIEKKFNARDWGSYTIDEQPTRGTPGGGASMDILTTYAMLSHGAKSNLFDALSIKGQKNEEYWRNLRLGLPTPAPQSLFVWDKFKTYLQGAGVNLQKEGNYIKMVPLTDKDVLKLSSGKLTDAGQMLKGKNLAARKGGLFDPEITGGANGKLWSHIELDEKLPNPMYEVAIRSILEITKNDLNSILEGTKSIEIGGKTYTGTKAVEKLLSNIDIVQELKITKDKLKKSGKTGVDKLNRKIRYLEALNTTGHTPAEAYLMKFIPVIPPLFRPVVPLPSGDLHVAPMNHHYHDIALLNNALKTEKDTADDPEQIGKIRKDLYLALKAAQGHIDPVTFRKEKYEGLIATLAGSQPKYGLIQEKMWGKRQDLSGRTTITLEPDLGMDEVGLPIEMAKKLYKPFVIRELIRSGFKQTDTLKSVKEWEPSAQKALEVVIKERPILINRAPSLHRWSIQAMIPRLHSGKDLKMNPIVQGFNADYDGDAMSIHIPVSSESVDEAWAMLPSRNMLHPSTNPFEPKGVHGLSKEFTIGVYHMTRLGKKTNKSFPSLSEAKKAEKLGEINVRDSIKIDGKTTTLGRALLNNVLPKGITINTTVDKKTLENLFVNIAMQYPKNLATVMDNVKDYGAYYGHRYPTSVSLEDLHGNPKMVKSIIDKYDKKITTSMNDSKKAEVWVDMTDELFKENAKFLKSKDDTSNFKHILQSGSVSGGKAMGLHQITSALGAVKDMYNNPLPIPIKGNYARGLDTFEYFQSMYGARKGAVDRAVNTQDSGELNKNLLSNTKSLLIVEEDCGTFDFISVDENDKSLPGRFLAEDTPKVGKKNTLITPQLVAKLIKTAGVTVLKVRSPLTCESVGGICQQCYGVLANGRPPILGTNVGIMDAQTLTERSTQLTMQTFHTGASAARGAAQAAAASFKDLEEIFHMPEILPGKATLSTVTGKINNIRKHPSGGYEIFVEDVPHYIPAGYDLSVKEGDHVFKGDKLSIGKAKPQELAKLKDFKTAQEDLVNRIKQVYKDDFHSRTYETVIRGISDNAEVVSAPEDSGYYPGDYIPYSLSKKINKDNAIIGKDPIRVEPYFRAINVLPMDKDDWLAQMSSGHIKQNLVEAAARMRSTNIHGRDPLPGMLYSLEFGKKFNPTDGEFY